MISAPSRTGGRPTRQTTRLHAPNCPRQHDAQRQGDPHREAVSMADAREHREPLEQGQERQRNPSPEGLYIVAADEEEGSQAEQSVDRTERSPALHSGPKARAQGEECGPEQKVAQVDDDQEVLAEQGLEVGE